MIRPRSSWLRPPPGWTRRAHAGYAIHVEERHARDERRLFAWSVARGLEATPRRLDCRWLYDDEGSRIFEGITLLPEYYQTRTEDSILAASAAAIRERVGDVTVVELGSGSSTKTRRLLEAFVARAPSRYLPIDVSTGALEEACASLAGAFPGLHIEGVAATHERALPLVAAASPLILLFLGSSLGNLDAAEHEAFFARAAASLSPGDAFLLGVDLVKDAARLEAAYNDSAGLSARFAYNLFARMNRELGTAVPLDALDYVAWYDERSERIEMYVRFLREVEIALPLVERSFRIARGELVRTEISAKYRVEGCRSLAARHGFALEEVFEDDASLFAVLLLRRRADPPRVVEEKAAIEASLQTTRARTLELVAPLGDDDLRRQHDARMSPMLGDLGRVASFERLWLGERAIGAAGTTEEDFTLHRMVAQHEALHQETLLQALQLRHDLRYAPAFLVEEPDAPTARRHTGDPEMLLVPAGPFLLGTDDLRVAFDNERPQHAVDLPAFRIAAAPVSNDQWLRFIDDGGYERPELWSEAGWAWRRASSACAPEHWQRGDGEWLAWRFGRLERLDGDRPVIHVSWFEADAHARWRGMRLPTEAEWEKAAAWDPESGSARLYPWGAEVPGPSRANLDQAALGPTLTSRAGSLGRSFYGSRGMLGDVWEWTSSWFKPYPGFVAGRYREYSAPYFGERYRVLRGASWATPRIVARNTLRNWDFPERRQIFAGVRLAEDAPDRGDDGGRG